MNSIGYMIGQFSIMIILSVWGIFFGKKWYGWVFYGVGVALTFASLMGNQMKYNLLGLPNAMTGSWVIFLILMLAAGGIITFRFCKAIRTNMPQKQKNHYGKLTAANTAPTFKCTKCKIHLREDQTRFREGLPYCNSCYNNLNK